jgi:hypothetical protein
MISRLSPLPARTAGSTNLPERDNNPSRLVNKYLDSVANHKICHRPSRNLPFHPLVFSLGGIMNGSTTKVFASWKNRSWHGGHIT